MLHSSARRIEKTGVGKRVAAVGRPIMWPDVLRVLTEDETRSYAMNLFSRSGFSADEFGSGETSRGARRARWRGAREAMADALTRTEDWLEYQGIDHPRRAHRYDAERVAIRDVRRRLEWELWP
jgi:hypothetical protein